MKLIQESRMRVVHQHLREIAVTLNSFCIIEIIVLSFFSYLAFDLLMWYKSMMTVETFNGTAFWGAITGVIVAIFTAVKHINETFKEVRISEINKKREG